MIKNSITKILESITIFEVNVKNSNTYLLSTYSLIPTGSFGIKEADSVSQPPYWIYYRNDRYYSILDPHSGQNLGILPSAGFQPHLGQAAGAAAG